MTNHQTILTNAYAELLVLEHIEAGDDFYFAFASDLQEILKKHLSADEKKLVSAKKKAIMKEMNS
jgi:hypothetical protein